MFTYNLAEYDSEAIVKISRGSMNNYFKNSSGEIYIPKSEWDNYDLKYIEDSDLNKDDDISDDYEIIDSDILFPKNSEVRCDIRYEDILISDLKIKIKIDDYDKDLNNNNLLNNKLLFYIGGSIVMELSMEINLLLAKLSEKNKKEYDDLIEIPVVLFDLQKNKLKKFPLFLVNYQVVSIVIKITDNDSIIKNGVIFSYRKYKCNKSNSAINISSIEYPIIQTQNIQKILSNGCRQIKLDNLNSICQMLIIKLVDNNTFEDSIKKIILSLCDCDPIIWEDDEIIKYNICGNILYCIPLSPDIKSKKRMKKIFNNNENGYGINFSKIDKSILTFEFYCDNSYDYILSLTALNLNIIRIVGGAGCVVFSC